MVSTTIRKGLIKGFGATSTNILSLQLQLMDASELSVDEVSFDNMLAISVRNASPSPAPFAPSPPDGVPACPCTLPVSELQY